MKKFIAAFTLFAAILGLVIAAVSFFERRKELFCDDDYEDEYYGGQEYYAEDLPIDSAHEESDAADGKAESKE